MSGRALSLNHVSVIARDLEESLDFYVGLLGLEPVPTPNFGFPVQWLRVGDRQLHLFERPGEAPSHAHLALEIDDFMEVYRRAKARGALDHDTFGNAIYELPDGGIQLYLRDPAGNLVELDHRDASTIPQDEVPEYARLADRLSQEGDATRATLFEG
ncbi:MAG: VOC family protein [Thermoleophilia bacterium]|nr:VOC family protein [Thermoleophilia bacterium]